MSENKYSVIEISDSIIDVMNRQPLCQNKTEQQWVECSLQDPQYYSCIVEAYEQPIRRYVHRLLSISEDDTDDVLQDIFIKVYRYLVSYDSDYKLSTWIYQIAQTVCLDYYRKVERRPQCIENTDDTQILLDQIMSEENIEKNILDKEQTQEILRALDTLKPEYKSVLVLYYLEEKSYKEISDILKKPEGSIATLLSRGKKQLMQHTYLKNYYEITRK